MKQTPELARAQEQMRPGVLTLDGFLGTDTRNLVDILTADEAEIQRLGLTHAAIAERMKELRDAGRRGLGEFVSVSPAIEVRVDSVRGRIPCPFHENRAYRKINTTVRNAGVGPELTFTDLNIHMIEEHGFYEGIGSPFRMDPARLAAVLAIAKTD